MGDKQDSIIYIDAKARVIRAINRATTFVKASSEFNNDRTNVGKRAKIRQMLLGLNDIRRLVEEDIQLMETAVGQKTAPSEVLDNQCSASLIDSFDSLYYELAAFSEVHNFPLSPRFETSESSVFPSNQTTIQNNLSCFQLPKRKFPTFSGVITEWQGFEDLFISILSHAPDLPAVERFEYLKTSLEGEALSLIAHLSLTAANYHSAWEILKARYGNKRDLARVHLDALLLPHVVRFNDAKSIKTLLNCILENTAALDNLEFTTRTWSPILIHLFEKYLDYQLRSRWELVVGDNHRPKITEFIDFLRSHIRSAEIFPTSSLEPKLKLNPSSFSRSRTIQSKKVLTTSPMQSSGKCPICNQSHSIRQCSVFINKEPNERFQLAKTHRLCLNCLGLGHSSASCPSKYKCTTCHRSHHSLLHFNTKPSPSLTANVQTVSENNCSTSATSLIVKGKPKTTVLLSTVLLDIIASDGRRHTFRALFDSGAQASFITEKAACNLMLKRRHSTINISTFASSSPSPVCGQITISIIPCGQQAPTFCIDTYIVPTITGLTPQTPITPGNWDHLQNITLADPLYHRPQEVDVLLGADILPLLYLNGKITGQPGEPIAFETIFGWILLGPTNSNNHANATSLCVSISDNLDATIKQFWELEELPAIRHFSTDEKTAEEIYKNTTTRLNSGRFMVVIPFRKPFPLLGDSKSTALRRYQALEHRLNNNHDLRQQYIDFMEDYLMAGHMELIPTAEIDKVFHYYIPHHCVLRPDSITTKLRVVFNASARTSTGQSLNDSMYTGPKLQPNIQAVLLRSRLWKYLFMADIKQMYRQILIRPIDRDYLRIFWRFSQETPIQEYRLCTVTYGTSAAPYQALRTLRELAIVDGASFPIAASILLNDTFVDDILTGANSEKEVLEYQSQLVQLCSLAQFQLRKWASNNSQVIETVAAEDRAMSPSILFDICEQPELKVLGLKWDPKGDMFSFTTKPSLTKPTKRSVLSDIAKVFDPLGLLSPTTFWTKHVMQQLWTIGIKWDDNLPNDLLVQWTRYQSELKIIETISIPRMITFNEAQSIQLHVLSDSSEKGYAAAVYLRTHTGSSVKCRLIAGKSKVAPLKRLTIPRLELCGAVLAAKLLRFIIDTYANNLKIDDMYAWTDSTTALAWIRSSPHRWATFVANRTSQIQDLTTPSIWHHVPTQHNPADCASRGLYPSELANHPLWWTGPAYLKNPPSTWPSFVPCSQETNSNVTQEARKCTVLLINTKCLIQDILCRFSSLTTILNIIAYCLRFSMLRHLTSYTTTVDASERAHALLALIYYVQQHSYSDEIVQLLKDSRCSKNLRRLNPFIDEKGLIRVGGRLTNADLPYAQKHPLLLPSRHRLTALLIDHHHQRLKHPGATCLQAYLQREFWIQSARKEIRSRLRNCVACFRTRPRSVQPKMGNLPTYRVQQVKPFAISGVDYAGPITVKEARGRRSVGRLAYICLFVCTTTKAIHLELSSNLSTENFLMAFTRFSSRRGPIKEIHSDCGTNFVGASRLLNPLQQFTHSKPFQDKIHSHLSQQHITWHFNPPASPHFGGLWEAGVKSTKSLILRSIGLHKLTCEEFTTLLTQIEATLNTRPLCALSNDPNDFEALTPSHFLTLEPSTSLPEPFLENVPMSKLERWRLISDIHRYFWTRWKNEYLGSLQLRKKWSDSGQELNIGELVVIKEVTHPLHWKLGRIRQLHPGADGITRVATIDTTTGSLKRPSVKLCPLPIS